MKTPILKYCQGGKKMSLEIMLALSYLIGGVIALASFIRVTKKRILAVIGYVGILVALINNGWLDNVNYAIIIILSAMILMVYTLGEQHKYYSRQNHDQKTQKG